MTAAVAVAIVAATTKAATHGVPRRNLMTTGISVGFPGGAGNPSAASVAIPATLRAVGSLALAGPVHELELPKLELLLEETEPRPLTDVEQLVDRVHRLGLVGARGGFELRQRVETILDLGVVAR